MRLEANIVTGMAITTKMMKDTRIVTSYTNLATSPTILKCIASPIAVVKPTTKLIP